MALGGFRDRAKAVGDSLLEEHVHQVETTDDKGYVRGSVFLPDKIPEGVEFFNPGKGTHIIDVIPFYAGKYHPTRKEGELSYLVDYWCHRNIGIHFANLVCPTRTFKMAGLSDKICMFISRNRLPKAEWNKLRPMRRCAYLIWDHTTPEQEAKGIQIWEVSHHFFEKSVNAIAIDPRTGGVESWAHHDTGKSVSFTVSMSGKFLDDSGQQRDSIEYTGHKLLDRLNSPQIPDHILNQSFCLDDAMNMMVEDKDWDIAFPIAEGQGQSSSAPQRETSSGSFGREGVVKEKSMDTPTTTIDSCPEDGIVGTHFGKFTACAKCPIYDNCSDIHKSMQGEGPPAKENNILEDKTLSPGHDPGGAAKEVVKPMEDTPKTDPTPPTRPRLLRRRGA